jgi:hypothetical protein
MVTISFCALSLCAPYALGSVYFCFFVEIRGPEPPILTCFLDDVIDTYFNMSFSPSSCVPCALVTLYFKKYHIYNCPFKLALLVMK